MVLCFPVPSVHSVTSCYFLFKSLLFKSVLNGGELGSGGAIYLPRPPIFHIRAQESGAHFTGPTAYFG